jgi:hypothetical protein
LAWLRASHRFHAVASTTNSSGVVSTADTDVEATRLRQDA